MVLMLIFWLLFQSKLIKLVARQLITKTLLKLEHVPKDLVAYPNTEQWLHIVGVNRDTINVSLFPMTSCSRALSGNTERNQHYKEKFHMIHNKDDFMKNI